VLDGQLYLVDFTDNNAELDTCLIAKTNMGWLCHHRLAHVGMKNLHKLLKWNTLSGTIIRGTLKTPNSQLVTPISTKLQRPDGCD
jgi:hypothetical protein